MKNKLVLFIICMFQFTFSAKSQMVYMPDSNLRNALITKGYGSCIVGDSINSSCQMVMDSTYLYFANNGITNLQGIQAFTSLNFLEIYNNAGLQIPALPTSLDSIICNYCGLTTLPTLPPSLIYLDINFNSLTSIPVLPGTLIHLACEQNPLTGLPSLPSSLKWLWCTNCNLTSIPTLPGSIEFLDFRLNRVTVMPNLSGLNNLYGLYFYYNRISSLPFIPSSVIFMSCGYNPISNLPSLPGNLQWFRCDSMNITSLPPLPSTLQTFSCGLNAITSLPTLPTSLIDFTCNYTLISSIPELPSSLHTLQVDNNPNLFCLPDLKNVTSLYFQNTSITCLPNYGHITNSQPQLSSVPLCDLFNSGSCNFYWNISGKTYFDQNNNCIQDANDTGLVNMHLNLYQNNNLIQQTFTHDGGNYSFDVNVPGNYEVRLDTTGIPFSIQCPATQFYYDTLTVSDSLDMNRNFSLRCETGYDAGVWSIYTSRLKPGDTSTVYIDAGDIANRYGVHCANGISGTLTVSITGSTQYTGPAPGAMSPTTVTGNVLTYSISDFSLINSQNDFVFEVVTDTNSVIGSSICIDAVITTPTTDNDTSNNHEINCSTIVSSFDPNDKSVYPEGIIDTSVHWLTYTIRFQNTGTAEAEHIYIIDTLNSNFDLSTFQLVSSSHPTIAQILDGGIARFNFPYINLPDSNTNEPASHGYVQYKIRLLNNLPITTQFNNTAYIVFDFNTPVVTNTTSNTIDLPNVIIDRKYSIIKMWPVPFRETLNIEADSRIMYYSITDLMGRELLSGRSDNLNLTLNTEEWPAGFYFLKLETKQETELRKLVKQ